MKRHNENGLTLVEILGTIVILALVSTFLFSIMNNSYSQQKEQTEEVQQIQNGAYLLKQITLDLRKSLSVSEQDLGTEKVYYLYSSPDGTGTPLYTYKINNGDLDLYRNGMLIANEVVDFSITNNTTYATLEFKLNGEPYSTTIAFRRGTP